MMYTKILVVMLKFFWHIRLWWKKKKKIITCKKKIIIIIGLMKDEKDCKIITKFAVAAPKSYSYCEQNDTHEIEDSEFIRAKWVKKLAGKDFLIVKSVFLIQWTLLSQKEQVSFRSIKHLIYSITKSIIALHKINDKDILEENKKTAYPLRSNILL